MVENVQYILTLKDLLSGKLTAADNSAKKLESSMGSLQSRVSGVGTAIGAAFAVAGVAAVGAFAAKVISAGTTVENAKTGLTTLLKDSDMAGKVIQNTMKDATETPFAFEGLLSANKALIGAGISADKAREDVLNLSNAIAATGGGDDELQRMVVNMQQISNTGKATALDIKQFAFAGINIYKVLAEATGKPIEAVKDMEVTYDMLTMALKKAHDQGGIYANGLENMQKNTSVQISNLGDAMFQLSVKMFNDLKPAIDATISTMMDFVKAMRDAWDFLNDLPNLYAKNKEKIDILAGAVISGTAAWVTYTTWTGRAAIASGIMTTYTIIETAALYALGTAAAFVNAMFIASPIGWVVGGMMLIGAAVMYAWNKFETFRATLTGFWEWTKVWAGGVGQIFKGLGQIIAGALTFDMAKISEGYTNMATAMADTGKKAGEAYERGFNTGRNNFRLAKLEGDPGTVQVGAAGATAKTGPKADPAAPTKDISPKGATGQKITTINISINNLIEQFKISTTNMPESTSKVRELVAQTLLSAVNDSQITAGI